MNTPDNHVFHSSNRREKQSVIEAITNFLSDEDVMATVGWSWDRVSVSCDPDSDFSHLHRPGATCLARLIRQPDFKKIAAEHGIPRTDIFHVNEHGHLFYSYDNISTHEVNGELVTVSFFSERNDIAHHFTGIADFAEQLRLLSGSAKLTGGWVTSTEKITLSQWLRFHGLPLPSNAESAKELIDLLNVSTLPASSPHGNYWELLNSPKDSPFELTEQNRALIRDVIEEETGGELPLVSLYGHALKLESFSADKLPTSQGYRLTRLIDIAISSANNGHAFMTALGWFAEENGPKPTEQFIEQLMIAVMLLDLDPELDSANTSFAGFDLYSKRYLLLPPSVVRTQLEQHLVSQLQLDAIIAPLVAELVLGGMAPEYLADELPSNLRIGTPAWVVFTQAVHFAEAITPGVSRSMSYQHLLGFARASQLTPELKAVFATHSADPVITWALMNELIVRDSEGNLSQQAVSVATQEYKQHADMMTSALIDLGKPLPHRKAIALKELKSQVPDCDPEELLVKHRGTGGGAGRRVSVVDLYLGDELHTQDWDRAKGTSIYEAFPDLADMYPVADLFQQAIHNHHNSMTEALSAIINVTFSQLSPTDRSFIEDGHLGIYSVQEYTTTRFTNIPNPTGVARPTTPVPGKTGRYGVLICAVLDSELRCYQLFPMRTECVYSEELGEVFRPLFMASGSAVATFVNHKHHLEGRLDIQAYRANTAPRSYSRSAFFIRKIGEFNPSSASADTPSPNRYFRSTRKEAISDLIAKENPYFTVDELMQLGLDQTRREKAIEKTDAIFTFLLNLIIPFKECVEELSSGVAARQNRAIHGCVMDAAALAVSFAVVGIKVAAISAKATTLVSRLLSTSKVVGSTVISLFNPIDGVPQLLKGGGKLLARGVKKLGAHALSTPYLARRQLRYLTGANSYDLLRAINHTGAGPRIRMSLDTVAHGRALFKDDSIQTVEQIVSRLGNKNSRLPDGALPSELEHLFNNALVESALGLKQAQDLQGLIGRAPVDDLFKAVLEKAQYSYTSARSASGAQGYADTLATFAQVEAKNVTYMKNYQQNVLRQDLGKAPFNQVMPESAFNPMGFTDNSQRAGAWIVNGSTSPGNDLDSIVAVLREYAGNQKTLTDPTVIKQLHARIAPATSDVVRVGVNDKKYASNISGFAAMEQHLKTLNSSHEHFDKQLLATVVGFHGLGDGNGRTGRALYAISQLRNNRFTPLTKQEFSLLHGLD
ncbi:hypothetical protein C5612_21740 [Pseudomonas frederiksbergensis]|uniref:Fido domain-containing protein n=1 Tax=Pseudomonas frederiksbergensis TaxID=104087 RepID=A0A2S8HDT0_9PSED|nr:hypothetical protein [Pseudomonas frederiksbergensis]PQP00583.1 hypothetical protein C5612_21740 [Pseudomonas frederiksbergensis]